jgi:hypothetical protein
MVAVGKEGQRQFDGLSLCADWSEESRAPLGRRYARHACQQRQHVSRLCGGGQFGLPEPLFFAFGVEQRLSGNGDSGLLDRGRLFADGLNCGQLRRADWGIAADELLQRLVSFARVERCNADDVHDVSNRELSADLS